MSVYLLPGWISQYVGLPFEEHGRGPRFDCWGLARLVQREQFGVTDLPEFNRDYETVKDRKIADLMAGEVARAWAQVPHGMLGDIIAFRIAGRPMHFGTIIDDTWMLHIEAGTDSCLARWNSQPWGNRIEGIYRHISRLEAANDG